MVRSFTLLILSAAALSACEPSPSPEASPGTGSGQVTRSTSPGATQPAPMPTEEPPSPVANDAPPAGCGADKATRHVGREATPEVRSEVAGEVGQRTIRWIGPDDAVTMDFSPARLNMMLNDRNVIVQAKCG